MLFAVSILLGSLLVQTSFTAVIGIFGVAFGSAVLASRQAFGLVAMSLCAPVAAVGLSYPDTGKALGLGLIVLGGSVFSYLVSMLYPESSGAGPGQQPPLLPPKLAVRYGYDWAWRRRSPPPSGSPSTRTMWAGRRPRPSS